ncbi:glutamyl-tRNA reductase [Francisella adeliensis]|uniref:Glutamyl-tRNA reductase n=1 Tax=Francisella adeliensis TaxID=2007306 RepID=A0A2Z4XXB5_9GAMM|nr:glutamyl-tRNA reductase [Francisella adeliensis]AXA33366.1 glutamyl-tRNA reductase [Francisella adeliensis]MBK2085380.1 glutamyl-tRNA reductase [Francisella adeliensis]MBK2097110.1 glutamyl-tRNA reductase [Francisella adeliensis]QIW11594.1 glutamyl-tRNA reductase [Francisella adeliensis]QIW13469.1 glutamyl-tRNA reductase [Francisella adeliensis]
MALISLAIDYKKSATEVRSEFALSSFNVADLYTSVLEIKDVDYAVILSTCNRTEIYLEIADLRVVDDVLVWWQDRVGKTKHLLKDYFKLRQGTEVIKHLMKLACGLESMVLGEPQILGQVKDSYTQSKENEALGKELDRVFQKVFSTAKAVRSGTKIGHCPVSVAFSAISLAKKQLEHINTKNVLIIGAGQTGELLFRHITALSPKRIMLANRSIEKAEKITSNFKNAESYNLDILDDLINAADIVIAAVSLNQYIVTPANAGDRARVFIDLSIPQVLDPALSENSIYYCVDDINNAVEEGKGRREQESKRAHKIIVKSLEEYLEKEKEIISNNAIYELFQKADNMVDFSLEKNLTKIRNGKDAEEIMKRFAHEIKKKVLHYPIVGMKEASKQGRNECLVCMKRMFGLNLEK